MSFVTTEHIYRCYYAGARGYYVSLRYEEFGLPVLKQCTLVFPVLTSDVSSLPEVVGRAGMMIALSDVNLAMTAELEGVVMADEQLRVRMAEYGLACACGYAW